MYKDWMSEIYGLLDTIVYHETTAFVEWKKI